jgi:hypothetical protein
MLRCTIFLFSIYMSGCTNNVADSSIRNQPSSVSHQDRVIRNNDTTCYKMEKELNGLELLDVCYVRFGDSLGRVYLRSLNRQESKSKFYNFEPEEHHNLTYQTYEDTLIIRIYYGTYERKNMIEPDSVSYKNGIIILKEKKGKESENPRTYGLALDEMIYVFKNSNPKLEPMFRHSWKL